MSSTPVAYVGVGGNVGTVPELTARFAAVLRELTALELVASARSSPLYRSKPVGPVSEQPAYVNAVVELRLRADCGARALLQALLALEARHGRDRGRETPQGPRTLDLDLLVYGERVIDEAPALIVPHPRLHQRAFALVPLAELAGDDFVLPGRGDTLAACLDDPEVRAQRSDLVLLAADETT